jgi:hypothetical protein
MQRVIILGASNVTIAFPRLWHGLRRAVGEPVDLFAAHGHGRSFGMWSRVGPRELPGIVPCRIWDDLSAQPTTNDLQPLALVTDIGNDLLYGATPDQICEWVKACVSRLKSMSARVVLTQLPLASVEQLGPRRFQLFRSAFFPGSQLRFDELHAKVTRLNELVVELGQSHNLPTPTPRGEWYGFDPIHIRRRHRDAAWGELLASWFDQPNAAAFRRVGPARALSLWRQRPFERRWFGRVQSSPQPVLREQDGSRLWLY